jgi:uncharacterized protein
MCEVVIRRDRSSNRDAVGVPLAVPEVVGGKARFNGRTLTDWVGDAVDRLVDAIEPRAVVLFGSVARGDDGPYSDIDLLAIIDDGRRQHEFATAALRAVAGLPPEVDVVVVTQRSVESHRDVPGTIIRPALREGRVVYRRGHRPFAIAAEAAHCEEQSSSSE